MSTSKHIDKICCLVLILALLLTLAFMNGEALGIQVANRSMGYEERLFATDRVHTIDIVMDDWESFISTAESEEYSACTVVIDGENYSNVGIRGKGNTSLSSVSSMGSDRYSFKIEFDQYDSTKSYYGLDKLCLNNIIQDTTFMKDYLTYQLMGQFGVAAPLCSFVYINVNGEEWGLYLAVEGIEDGFLQRNYGNEYGELYKPDSLSFGGGRGNGRDFNMDDFMEDFNAEDMQQFLPDGVELPEDFDFSQFSPDGQMPEMGGIPQMPANGELGQFSAADEATQPSQSNEGIQHPSRENFGFEDFDGGRGGMGGFGGMGSEDVKLQYIDDDPDSYSNIFNSAKTDITEADKTRLIQSLKALSEGDAESSVDIEAVIRYFVVHNFVVNGDSYTGNMIHNYYLYENDGFMSMIPWDYNLAYGTFQGNDASSAVNDPIDDGSTMDDRPMISWIFSSEEYTRLYHELFAQFLETVDIISIIDNAYKLIAPYVEKDPSKFCTYEEFELGVNTLREFCTLRSQSIKGQLDGTIPSTSEGQNADSSALIDASSITISEMGSMGMGGGGFDGGHGQQRSEQAEQTQSTDGEGQLFQPPEMQQGAAQQIFPRTESEHGTEPDQVQSSLNHDSSSIQRPSIRQTGASQSSIILLAVCVLILFAGIVVAAKYRR